MSVAARTGSEARLTHRKPLGHAFWDAVSITASGAMIPIAVVFALIGLILALQWYSRPFLGVFAYPTGIVIGTRPLAETTWTGLEAGLQADDRIIRINDTSFQDAPAPGLRINDYLATRAFGETVSVTVLRPADRYSPDSMPGCAAPTGEGALCTFSFALMRIPLIDFLGFFGLGFVVALCGIGLGAWLWLKHRRDVAARTVCAICMAGAMLFIARFEVTSTYLFSGSIGLLCCIIGGLTLNLGLWFPYPLKIARRMPMLRGAVIVLPVAVYFIYLELLARFNASGEDGLLLGVLIFLAGSTAFLVGSQYIRRRTSTYAMAREQSTIVLISALVPLIPVVLWIVTNLLERITGIVGISFSTIYLQPTAIIFPIGVAYAILQQRRIDMDRLVNETIILSALGVLLIVGYVLLTGAAFALTAGVIRPNNPLIVAITIFFVAVLFTPLRRRMEELVDEAFFRQRRDYDRRLEQFSRALTTTIETGDIVDVLTREISEALAPQYIFVYLRNPASGEYEPVPDKATGKPQTNIRFKQDSGLLRLLNGKQTIFNLERDDLPGVELQSDRSRLAVLNTPIIARLHSVRRLNGFVALGPRRERAEYRPEDLRYLEGVVTQAAAAFERAQVLLEAKQNERELKVLFQVSSALNIAMEFDVLLEFIYAQVDKVITAPNFYIALRDHKTDELYYAFYQEAGDRIPEKEGQRWPMGRDLMSEVVRTGQSLRTDNYVREMQRRDSSNRIDNPDLRAWMGVPLNAGDQRTLGGLAIGSTDPAVTYTEDQNRVFQGIADLAATAIYKTRLFSETAELARQMQVLNDTSSQLATLFEDIDALLQKITESAVAILNCEAGSLLLVDDQTNDLVFRCAVGGNAESLIGMHIPAGSGIAGTVAMTGRHMIVNEVQREPRWYGEVGANEESSFSTSSILAVPLVSRGRVLGVLEVINKQDRTEFDDSNVNLLTTFAGQAAIAIENASLFRMTDEALAERVKQLFNMQRIDQELNRTLDLQRVVDLTVDNAIRESNADAGALGLVSHDPPGLRIMGSAGYPERILATGQLFDFESGILGEVYQTGQPILVTSLAGKQSWENTQILPGAQQQLCVPLITGETVTGVLLLESTMLNTFTPMTVEHIQGLAEHANTAITNARLFAQLGEANTARTKVMGIVAHELKNPMTSIKGFSEGMLAGMAGQLSDRQKEMLATIRRNVVRMQQLVDDLRDITAQETGNLKLAMGVVNFTNIVLDSVRPQQRSIDEKHQTIILNVPEDLPRVWGDEGRLIQIMTNFISNANKYTPEGGTITITAEHSANKWDVEGPLEVIHCSVTDTGIGMSPEDLKNLFKPYWRSDNPMAREQTGTGLGMSLTRGLVEAHGGRVWVVSELGIGTTFHFTIPLATEAASVQR